VCLTLAWACGRTSTSDPDTDGPGGREKGKGQGGGKERKREDVGEEGWRYRGREGGARDGG
jgi:hypothetical protein